MSAGTRPEPVDVQVSRAEVLAGITEERERFCELALSLDEKAWNAPTRCAGWAVSDVVAHLAGIFTDLAFGRFDGQGQPPTTERQVQERRGRTRDELLRELRKGGRLVDRMVASLPEDGWSLPAPGGFSGPLRRAVQMIWYDLYVHSDDVRAAAGLPSERGPGLRAAVLHAADTLGRWGWRPVTLHLEGMEPVAIRGGAKDAADVVEADALAFLLAATGRLDPAAVGLDDRVNIYR